MEFKSILAIGAHPDDIELSCFGFLLKQQKLGSNIHAFIASPDSLTENPKTEIRTKESQEAFSLIPESNLFIRTTNNINMENYQEICDQIRNMAISNNIDLVIVHYPKDTMQEHRLLNEITMTALRRLPVSIFLYKSPSTIKFIPNLFVDINKEYDAKVKAISCHKTQANKEYMHPDSIKIFNQGWDGKSIGIDIYEQFNILRMVK